MIKRNFEVAKPLVSPLQNKNFKTKTSKQKVKIKGEENFHFSHLLKNI